MYVGVNNSKIDINITPCKKKGLFNADLQQAFNWAGVRPGQDYKGESRCLPLIKKLLLKLSCV